jgi:hypothetical protein
MFSAQSYACYNQGWKPGQGMYPTNFVGFVGGAYASGPRQACPWCMPRSGRRDRVAPAR